MSDLENSCNPRTNPQLWLKLRYFINIVWPRRGVGGGAVGEKLAAISD